MGQVSCSRCGNMGEGLERPPLPGGPGKRVMERTCRACWAEWLGAQVKLINEYRINPAEPKQYGLLLKEMDRFLKLANE